MGETISMSSVAADSLPCGHCGELNRRGLKFCNKCGKAFAETCPQCDGECIAGEKFCGHCGVNRFEIIDQQRKEAQENLRRAEQLAANSEFSDAIQLLVETVKLDGGWLQDIVQQANVLSRRFQRLRKRREIETEDDVRIAAEKLKSNNYQQAVEILTNMPAALRTEESIQLLDAATTKLNQLQALRARIQNAVKTKQTDDLLVDLSEFLALKPNDPQGMQLAKKMTAVHHQHAKRLIGKHDFDAAESRLSEIPEFLRTDETKSLLLHSEELRYLTHHLQNEPYVDAVLVAVLERVEKQAGEYPVLKKWRKDLESRQEKWPDDVSRRVLRWATTNDSKKLGLPLRFPRRFRRLNDDAVRNLATYRFHTDRMFVAAGLALQGLEQSVVSTNLMPPEPKKMKVGLGGLLKRKQAVTAAWGIDIGTTSLKAIKLEIENVTEEDDEGNETKSQVTKIVDCKLIPHSENLIDDETGSHDDPIIKETLERFAKGIEFEGSQVCVSLPGEKVLSRFVEIPTPDIKKVKSAVEYEAKSQIPIPLEELQWGYQLLREPNPKAKSIVEVPVVLLATKKRNAENRKRQFEEVDIPIDMLQADFAALHNIQFYEQLHDAEDYLTIATLDIGCSSSNIVVSGKRVLWTRSLPVGTDQLIDALARQFKLTKAKAAEVLCKPERVRLLGKFFSAIEPVCSQVESEVTRSLAALKNANKDAMPYELNAVGGGIQTHGMMRYLMVGD